MFKKLKPIKGVYDGCLHCGYQYEILPMESLIAVGFGVANVTKNEEVVVDGEAIANNEERYYTVQDAENMAKNEPNNDWRIHLISPLSERHYQRQGDSHWVLYEKGDGFA